MKEGAIIHLVLTRSCDLVEPHVPLRSARQKGVTSNDTRYLDFPCKSQGQAPAPSSSQAPYPSPRRLRQGSLIPLLVLSPKSHSTFRGPRYPEGR